MLGLLGKGPDPRGMSCPAVIKGYKTNQRLAKERGKSHQKQHLDRVKELQARYNECTEEQATAPIEQQAEEIQAVYDQIYGSAAQITGSAGGASGQFTTSAPVASGGLDINWGRIALIAAIGFGAILVIRKMRNKGQ